MIVTPSCTWGSPNTCFTVTTSRAFSSTWLRSVMDPPLGAAGELYPRVGHLPQGRFGAVGVDPRDQIGEHARFKAGLHRVQRRPPHAVVGGQPGQVEAGDAVVAQELFEGVALVVDGLEGGVGSRVSALVEHAVEPGGSEVRMELGAPRAGHAVGRPAVTEVGVIGEVV